jgi:hypothetical protein
MGSDFNIAGIDGASIKKDKGEKMTVTVDGATVTFKSAKVSNPVA